MVSGAELEVLRLVVKEKSPTEDQYVIDLIKKKVFAKKHESANVMEVSLSGDKNKPFEVVPQTCGSSITKPCGIIELPATYGPGLDCTWTFAVDEPIEYSFDTFEVSRGAFFVLKMSIFPISRCRKREMMSFLSMAPRQQPSQTKQNSKVDLR